MTAKTIGRITPPRPVPAFLLAQRLDVAELAAKVESLSERLTAVMKELAAIKEERT